MKQLIILPLLAVLVMGLSNKEVKKVYLRNNQTTIHTTLSEAEQVKIIKGVMVADIVEKVDNIEIMSIEDGKESVGVLDSTNHKTIIRISTPKSLKDPVIVLDGKVIDSVENINPDTIKSVKVLKGDSAIALYGDKGKNGVVLVTTKNPQKEKIVVGYPSPSNLKTTATCKNSDYDKAGFDFGSFKDVQLYGPPIVIVDGQRYDSVEDAKIDPSDVANLSVLKNETAQSYVKIYGKEALNGVIIINTKTKYNSGDEVLTPKVRNINNNGEPVFYKIEKMPEFPGGEQALREFLANKIKYPETAKENGIQGKVYVTFVIAKNGKVTEPEITRGVDPVLDKEALRVVSKMPYWNPGKKNGEAVNVSYTVPVNFVLQENISKKEDPLIVVNGIISENKKIDDFNPETIESINVLKDASATEKYGVKGKDGVIEITLKPEIITTDLRLRKFIAREIKYPVVAQENGIEGKISMAVTFDKNGNIVKIDKSSLKYDNLDEVVVTALNSEKKQHFQCNDSEPLKQEMIRIINLIPPVEIDELKGKTINIVVKFVLQD